MKKRAPKQISTVSAWSTLEDMAFDMGASSRQLAIVILFAEAQRKRTRIKRSGLRVPLHGLAQSKSGPVRITVVTRG